MSALKSPLRSAATILSLLEEGSFDYGSMFTDQAPLRTDSNNMPVS